MPFNIKSYRCTSSVYCPFCNLIGWATLWLVIYPLILDDTQNVSSVAFSLLWFCIDNLLSCTSCWLEPTCNSHIGSEIISLRWMLYWNNTLVKTAHSDPEPIITHVYIYQQVSVWTLTYWLLINILFSFKTSSKRSWLRSHVELFKHLWLVCACAFLPPR